VNKIFQGKINMQKTLAGISLTFFSLVILLLCANLISAQNDTTPKKRLNSPATVSGLIGGEAHHSYVIRASRGQTMTVQISWKRDDDNRAEFTVSRGANFFKAGTVKFGKESNNGQRWTGVIPKAGNYYIYVVAHPTAKYTLKVTLK
jgi:hypothetical protein